MKRFTDAPTPKSPKDFKDRADALHKDLGAVTGRTVALAGSHGRARVLAILRQFNAGRVSDLTIGNVWSYCYKLEQLGAEAPGFEHALQAARALADKACGNYYEGLGRDEIMFEAGREYQRKN